MESIYKLRVNIIILKHLDELTKDQMGLQVLLVSIINIIDAAGTRRSEEFIKEDLHYNREELVHALVFSREPMRFAYHLGDLR
mmetsp:Transcript_25306/g.25044  ORF Transcript_25306/g.25044 Transcript_25306/m.25044 type:complete len:83 (+) Transcript_25306:194-442(+)